MVVCFRKQQHPPGSSAVGQERQDGDIGAWHRRQRGASLAAAGNSIAVVYGPLTVSLCVGLLQGGMVAMAVLYPLDQIKTIMQGEQATHPFE